MEIEENISEFLMNDTCGDGDKLKVLQNLREKFKPPDKILSKLELVSVLQSARISLESKAKSKDFLFGYGISLIRNIGRNATVESEIFCHLEFVFQKLRENDQTLTNTLVIELWKKLTSGSIFQRNEILNASKEVIENTVLDWVDTTDTPQLEFLSKISTDSPKLFQTITSILYEVLVRTYCHLRVLELHKLYILSVKHECQRMGKNFLGLYPKGCARLISLLMLSPEAYREGGEDILSSVISLFFEMFLVNKKRTLTLLSHFPEWVSVFKHHLEENEI